MRTKDRPFDPDPKHLNKHNVHTCVNKKFTRKENLIEHYKKHHDFDDDSELASHSTNSKYTVDLKNLACGFCGHYYGLLDDLIYHVDAEHYRYFASISCWDDNKVIRTLLSVNKCWQDFLAANSNVPESGFTWDARHVKKLQRRLEKGREPAGSLCKAAFDKSNFGMSRHDQFESGVTHKGMDISQSIQTFRQANGLYPRVHTSERDADFDHPPATVLTTPSQGLRWNDWESLNSYLPWGETTPFTQMCSETHGSPISVMNYDAGPRMRSFDLPNSGKRLAYHQHPAQPYAGSFYPALTAQSTSSSLSSNSAPSSLGQPNSTYSPEYRLAMATQVSHPEME